MRKSGRLRTRWPRLPQDLRRLQGRHRARQRQTDGDPGQDDQRLDIGPRRRRTERNPPDQGAHQPAAERPSEPRCISRTRYSEEVSRLVISEPRLLPTRTGHSLSMSTCGLDAASLGGAIYRSGMTRHRGAWELPGDEVVRGGDGGKRKGGSLDHVGVHTSSPFACTF